MRKSKTNSVKLGLIAIVVFGLIFAVVSATRDWGKSQDAISAETSLKKLNQLYGRLRVDTLNPRKDEAFIYDEAVTVLPDLSEYPFVVNPATAHFLTVYACTEKAGADSWMADAAERFNQSGAEIDGNPVSVGIRAVPSGLGADFIAADKYKPDVYAPSTQLWGDMLISKGVNAHLIAERVAGNVAGVALYNKKYDEMTAKHGSLSAKTIIDSILSGEVQIGYTNPLSSSEGLNFVLTALFTFDERNPLGDGSISQLRTFQDNIRYVSYNVSQLRNSAQGGALDGFVTDYQLYTTSPELVSAYKFIPFGVRHDHPLYAIGELSPVKKQIAEAFAAFCLTEDSQKAAKDRGFYGLDDYVLTQTKPDGTTILQAQEAWKKEKNGSSDLTAVFVADVSGSMEGSPLLKLKASLNRAATFIDMNTNVGLVTFSDTVSVALPIAKFDQDQKSYFSNAVKSMRAGGGTAMFDAIVVAQKMLMDAQARNPNTKLMLFVLTDGETNRGYEFREVEDLIRALRIPIYTIGYEADIEILESVSAINEAITMNADTDDVIYKLQSLFNAQM